jgi:hypothetical protein
LGNAPPVEMKHLREEAASPLKSNQKSSLITTGHLGNDFGPSQYNTSQRLLKGNTMTNIQDLHKVKASISARRIID